MGDRDAAVLVAAADRERRARDAALRRRAPAAAPRTNVVLPAPTSPSTQDDVARPQLARRPRAPSAAVSVGGRWSSVAQKASGSIVRRRRPTPISTNRPRPSRRARADLEPVFGSCAVAAAAPARGLGLGRRSSAAAAARGARARAPACRRLRPIRPGSSSLARRLGARRARAPARPANGSWYWSSPAPWAKAGPSAGRGRASRAMRVARRGTGGNVVRAAAERRDAAVPSRRCRPCTSSLLTDRDWTHPRAAGPGTNLYGQVARWLAWGHRVTVDRRRLPGRQGRRAARAEPRRSTAWARG